MKKLLVCLLAGALLTGTALTAEAAKQMRLVKAKVCFRQWQNSRQQ